MKKISILIADDHKLIRETWAYILNSDSRFEVIATCSNAEEAIAIAKEKNPDIILMDINMTPVSGLEATQQIRKILPMARVIGVSMHSQPRRVAGPPRFLFRDQERCRAPRVGPAARPHSAPGEPYPGCHLRGL